MTAIPALHAKPSPTPLLSTAEDRNIVAGMVSALRLQYAATGVYETRALIAAGFTEEVTNRLGGTAQRLLELEINHTSQR